MIINYNFYKTKYGSELLIDLLRLESLEQYIANGHPHTLGYFDITLITSGAGIFCIDGKQFGIKPGLTLFSAPNQVRKWVFDRTPKGFVVIFEEEFLGTFFNDSQFVQKLSFYDALEASKMLELKGSTLNRIVDICENLEIEIVEGMKDSHMLRALLYQFLVALNREYINKHGGMERKGYPPIISRFMAMVNNDFTQHHSVEHYSDRLCITSGHLNDLCKSHLGVSTKNYILGKLNMEAKRLLSYSTLTITGISDQLGYNSTAQFSKSFKHHTGVTPLEFRRRS